MSLKSILKSVTTWAENIIANILPTTKHLTDAASYVVNAFKTIDTAHPEFLNALVALIPSSVPATILAEIRQYLPEVVIELNLAKAEEAKTPSQIVADAAAVINASPQKALLLGTVWNALAGKLTKGGLSVSDLQKLQQVYYEEVGSKLTLNPSAK